MGERIIKRGFHEKKLKRKKEQVTKMKQIVKR